MEKIIINGERPSNAFHVVRYAEPGKPNYVPFGLEDLRELSKYGDIVVTGDTVEFFVSNQRAAEIGPAGLLYAGSLFEALPALNGWAADTIVKAVDGGFMLRNSAD